MQTLDYFRKSNLEMITKLKEMKLQGQKERIKTQELTSKSRRKTPKEALEHVHQMYQKHRDKLDEIDEQRRKQDGFDDDKFLKGVNAYEEKKKNLADKITKLSKKPEVGKVSEWITREAYDTYDVHEVFYNNRGEQVVLNSAMKTRVKKPATDLYIGTRGKSKTLREKYQDEVEQERHHSKSKDSEKKIKNIIKKKTILLKADDEELNMTNKSMAVTGRTDRNKSMISHPMASNERADVTNKSVNKSTTKGANASKTIDNSTAGGNTTQSVAANKGDKSAVKTAQMLPDSKTCKLVDKDNCVVYVNYPGKRLKSTITKRDKEREEAKKHRADISSTKLSAASKPGNKENVHGNTSARKDSKHGDTSSRDSKRGRLHSERDDGDEDLRKEIQHEMDELRRHRLGKMADSPIGKQDRKSVIYEKKATIRRDSKGKRDSQFDEGDADFSAELRLRAHENRSISPRGIPHFLENFLISKARKIGYKATTEAMKKSGTVTKMLSDQAASTISQMMANVKKAAELEKSSVSSVLSDTYSKKSALKKGHVTNGQPLSNFDRSIEWHKGREDANPHLIDEISKAKEQREEEEAKKKQIEDEYRKLYGAPSKSKYILMELEAKRQAELAANPNKTWTRQGTHQDRESQSEVTERIPTTERETEDLIKMQKLPSKEDQSEMNESMSKPESSIREDDSSLMALKHIGGHNYPVSVFSGELSSLPPVQEPDIVKGSEEEGNQHAGEHQHDSMLDNSMSRFSSVKAGNLRFGKKAEGEESILDPEMSHIMPGLEKVDKTVEEYKKNDDEQNSAEFSPRPEPEEAAAGFELNEKKEEVPESSNPDQEKVQESDTLERKDE